MSNEKPKSSAAASKKVFDVARPGKSSASPTSKPIIITNRPVLKDPMMASGPAGVPPVEDKPVPSKPSTRIKIAPLSDDLETPSDPAAEDTAQKEPEAVPEAPADAEVPEASLADEGAETESPAEETASAEETTKSDKKEPDAAPEDEAKPQAEQTEPEVALEDDSEEDPDQPSAQRADQKEDEEVARKEAERQAEVQKVIMSRKYYLPIDAVGKRRAKRYVILGIVLIVILIAVWADIALDSGMFHVHGIKPLTHFFNK